MGEIAELCDLSGRRGIKRAGIGSDRGVFPPPGKPNGRCRTSTDVNVKNPGTFR